jgi:hypothetical protein
MERQHRIGWTVAAFLILTMASAGTSSAQAQAKPMWTGLASEAACGPQGLKHETSTDKTQHPIPEMQAGKALLYVVRPTMFGNKVQTKFAINGAWVGINRGDNYFFVFLDPGEYSFCSQAENKVTEKLAVEAGKTYYVQQKIRMGLLKARTEMDLLDETEGKEALTKCHPSHYELKKD